MTRSNYTRGVGLLALLAALVLSVFAAPAFVGGLDRAHADEELVEELGGDFVPLSPAVRVANTTSPSQPFASTDSTRTYQVLGVGGVPATDVQAVSATIAVVGTSTTGYVTTWASGTTRPGLPTLMFQPATAPDSNTAMVQVGSDGKIAVSVRQANTTATNITVEITGYVTTTPAESGGGFVPVTPTRVLATAQQQGQLTAPLPPSDTAEIDLSGVPGIPDDAAAAFINIGAIAPQDGVLKIAIPSDSQSAMVPLARYAAEQPSSTGLVARLDSAGHLRITNVSTTTSVNITLDVQGFFTANSSSDASGGFTAVTYRLLDTGTTGIPAQGTLNLQVSGRGAIPVAGVTAAALNVTVIDPTSTGFVKLWRAGDPLPPTSNLSFGAGQDQTNLSMVEVNDAGSVSIYNGATSPVRVVVDAQGWVATPEETVVERSETGGPPPGDPAEYDPNNVTETAVVTEYTYDLDGNLVLTDQHGLDTEGQELGTDETRSPAASGSGGSSSSSGCRKIVVKLVDHSNVGTWLYDYWEWTYWCWNRASQTISSTSLKTGANVKPSWAVEWKGTVSAAKYFYDYGTNDGHPKSAYKHYRKGHLQWTPTAPHWNYYPQLLLRSYYNGTYVWSRTDG